MILEYFTGLNKINRPNKMQFIFACGYRTLPYKTGCRICPISVTFQYPGLKEDKGPQSDKKCLCIVTYMLTSGVCL